MPACLPPPVASPASSDTTPLRRFLEAGLGSRDGSLPDIARNLARGTLKAVALTALEYDTGQTVTFVCERDIVDWERPRRRSVRVELTLDHILASAALPLFFPPVRVGGAWYGDGGVSQIAPLAPPLHLGAERILAISTRRVPADRASLGASSGAPPSPTRVMAALHDVVFHDHPDQDAANLERINRLLGRIPGPRPAATREVELLMIRPSVDLDALAEDFEAALPGAVRYMARRLGTTRARGRGSLGTLMFEPGYVRRSIEAGEGHVESRARGFDAFLSG